MSQLLRNFIQLPTPNGNDKDILMTIVTSQVLFFISVLCMLSNLPKLRKLMTFYPVQIESLFTEHLSSKINTANYDFVD